MKAILIFFALLGWSTGFAQSDSTGAIAPFELKIVTFNHAEQWSHGQMIYRVTHDSLLVERYQRRFQLTNLNSDSIKAADVSTTETLVAIRLQPTQELEQLSRVSLDHLNSFYSNDQVMITSGNEIFILFRRGGSEKKISLHAMTIPEVDALFACVNSLVPEKYRLD